MKPYQLEENEVFAIGTLLNNDARGCVICITKSVNQIINIATGIWSTENGAIWIEVWNYENGSNIDIDDTLMDSIDEWEHE